MVNYLQSLLGEDELNATKTSARNMGLLQAGLAGLMASGPSLTPVSAGQALGAAGLTGLASYQDAMSEAERQGVQGMELNQMRQTQESDAAFKAALPEVIKGGNINYPLLQQLAIAYPKEVGDFMTAYKSAQPPKEPTASPINLQFDAKTGSIFNPRTGEVTYAAGSQQQSGFSIPEGATPKQAANLYRNQARIVSGTDSAEAKRLFELANQVDPQDALKPPTEGQLTAGGYYDRMKNSVGIINPLETTGDFPGFQAASAQALPFIGDLAKRVVMSPKEQQYQQAADDWIRSKLRKESGAVISQDEMRSEYETYFPKPGDSAAVIEQKRKARDVATEAMKKAAGTAVQPSKANRFKFNPATGQIEAQ